MVIPAFAGKPEARKYGKRTGDGWRLEAGGWRLVGGEWAHRCCCRFKEAVWVDCCSQAAKAHDFITAFLLLVPKVVVAKAAEGYSCIGV